MKQEEKDRMIKVCRKFAEEYKDILKELANSEFGTKLINVWKKSNDDLITEGLVLQDYPIPGCWMKVSEKKMWDEVQPAMNKAYAESIWYNTFPNMPIGNEGIDPTNEIIYIWTEGK